MRVQKTVKTLLAGVLVGAAWLAANTLAASLSISLPPETAKLKPSTHPGYLIAMQKCAICHSADYVNQQPSKMTLTQWTAEVAKMKTAYGAPLSDDDVKQIGEYLATTYGDAKLATTTAAPPAEPAAATVSAPAKAVDVMALLNANACLACHAIDKTEVGPAYKDVAARYQHDAQALSKLEVSIRNGGTGKWGAAQMPPFTTLSQDEIRLLAQFVLKQ
ncbi:c-type cytochrome [Paraherbaspirillum soli]|uniref:C-type cytochrome n=1 Tax=Paraherbaspirillum soli TaxID=631222 RepID=A0ABW0MAR8_9BURK